MNCDCRMTSSRDLPPVRRFLLLIPLLLAGACASDSAGGYDSVEQMRSESVRPERPVPAQVTEMREDMASMRADTQSVLDQVMGGAPQAGPYWYGPIFDALDFAMSWARLLY